MKYFLILVVAVVSVRALIPSYIKTCRRNDPQINGCILSSISDLRERLIAGIPELGVPSIRKLLFKTLRLDLGPGLKADIQNLVLEGLEKFTFHSMDADLDANTFKFNISVPEIVTRGTYDMDAAIGSIPLRGKGPIYFATKTITGHGTLYGKKVPRGGKTLFYFERADLALIFDTYKIQLDNLFDGEPTIGKVTNKLLNEEKADVMASLLPGIEKAVTEKALLIGNNICKHFTWEELFPET